MEYSRRDLSLLLPLLAAAGASAQPATLPSKAFAYDDIPVKTSGANHSRAVMKGLTHSGFPIELHMTELGPHAAPHPPHKHVHEEIILVRTGAVEVTLLGQTGTYGPGSVIYFGSNDEHGMKNAGTDPAAYFVIALGHDT
jgi:mannose-6-phosphate isomerase-like protein (cupin superfamily)